MEICSVALFLYYHMKLREREKGGKRERTREQARRRKQERARFGKKNRTYH